MSLATLGAVYVRKRCSNCMITNLKDYCDVHCSLIYPAFGKHVALNSLLNPDSVFSRK